MYWRERSWRRSHISILTALGHTQDQPLMLCRDLSIRLVSACSVLLYVTGLHCETMCTAVNLPRMVTNQKQAGVDGGGDGAGQCRVSDSVLCRACSRTQVVTGLISPLDTLVPVRPPRFNIPQTTLLSLPHPIVLVSTFHLF